MSYCEPCKQERPYRSGTGHQRRPCISCGGEKEPGPGRTICKACATGSSIPAEQRAEMARLYREGMSLSALSARMYWSVSAIGTALRAEGVTLRPPGGLTRDRHPRALSDNDCARAVELYLSGLSYQQVADRLGLKSEWSARLRISRAGVDGRSRFGGDVFWLRRLSEVAERGMDALTPIQAASLRAIESEAPATITTDVIAEQIGAKVRTVKATLRGLERMGLVRGRRITTTRHRPKEWWRTDLQFVDVLRDHLNVRPAGGTSADVWLPVEPFRAWVSALIANERRKTMAAIIPSHEQVARPRSAEANDSGAMAYVANRIKLDQRRVYALMHEQKSISFTLADRAMTYWGEPVTVTLDGARVEVFGVDDLWAAETLSEDPRPRHYERRAA